MKGLRKVFALLISIVFLLQLVPLYASAEAAGFSPVIKTSANGTPVGVTPRAGNNDTHYEITVPGDTTELYISGLTECVGLSNSAGYVVWPFDDPEENPIPEDASYTEATGEYHILLSHFKATSGIFADQTYIQFYNEDYDVYAVVFVNFEGQASSIDTSDLDAVIAEIWDVSSSLPTNNYYTVTDRWNGTNAYPKDENNPERGFFWDTTEKDGNPLEAALGEFTSQTAVNNALENLQAAIEELIPSDQANTTLLYEAIQAYKDLSNNGNYSEASWNNFENAREDAETLMAKMFDASGDPLSDNNPNSNEAINAAAAALTQAYNDLLYADLASQINVWKRAETWLLSKTDLSADDYSNWSTWGDAYDALSAWRSKTVTLMSDYETWTGAIINAAKAYYGLEDVNAAVTVHVRVADNFGALYPQYALSSAAVASYDGDVPLSSSHSIDGLLTAIAFDLSAQSAIPYTDTNAVGQQPCVMVYINGTLAVYRDDVTTSYWNGELFNGTSKIQGVADIQLHDGDDVVIVRAQAPYYTYYIDTIPNAPYTSYYNSAALLDIQNNSGVVEVEAGSEFSLSVIKKDGAPENTAYGTSAKPAYGASFFLSDVQSDDAAAKGAFATTPTDAVTNSSGSASLTIYVEGWYKLFVADVRSSTAAASQGNTFTEGTYPNLAGGDYVLVHVKTPEDDSAVRAELQAELDEVYQAYGQDFYTEEQWETVTTAYQTASETIRTSELLGDAYNAQQAAIETIRALQEANSEQNEFVQRRMSSLLMLLPTESEISAGLFTQGDAQRMNEALAHYETLTDYQRTMLTAAQASQWDALQDAWGTDGSGLPTAGQINYTISVEGGFTEQMDSSISEFSTVRYSYVQSRDAYYPASTSYSIDSLAEPAVFAVDAPLEAWGLSVYFTKTDDFEVYKVTWDGVEEGVEYTIDLTEGVYSIYLSYTDAFKNEITKPALRSDVKVTIYTRSTDSLTSLREAAIEELTTALNGYNKSDYTTEKWAELIAAYNSGVEKINAATDESTIDTEKRNALAAMDAVPTRGEEGTLGYVTVIVENTIYDDAPAALKGRFVEEQIELTESTTMMNAVLDALEKNGYSWIGTGGSSADGTDKDITYIATISYGDDTLSEMDGAPTAGWMGVLNDWFVNEGFSSFKTSAAARDYQIVDGDEIRVMFTLAGYGADLGGSWGNSDTRIKELSYTGGTLSPDFSGSTYDYVLLLNTSGKGTVTLTPTAANKNYQVKIFLNEKQTARNVDYYRRGEPIPVQAGDVIYIGCGERNWLSMNNQGAQSTDYAGTWYKITIADSNSAAIVEQLIEQIGSVTYSNYADKTSLVEAAREAYDALSDEAKANVSNYDKLTAAEEKIKSYQAIDEVKDMLAALPKSSNLDDAGVLAARSAIEAADAAYKALTDEQKGYITVGDVANYNELVERLKALTPDTPADPITGSTTTPENKMPFVDVPEGAFYYDAVAWAVNHDPQITNGTSETTFEPNADCLREQIVTFLWRAAGKPAPSITESPFEDVAEGAYYYEAVLWAYENGITLGVDATHFGVGQPCTREQVVTFLWRAANKPATSVDESFTDVADGEYYAEAVNWAAEEEITLGIGDGKFGTGLTCTRGQIVTFLYRAREE